MTTEEWLSQARTIDMEIAALESARAKALNKCLSITAKQRDIVVSGGGVDQDSKLVAFADLSREIDEKILKQNTIKREILSAVQTVQDGKLRTLLIERYINLNTWEQVAANMNYSVSNVIQYLFPKALEEIKIPNKS